MISKKMILMQIVLVGSSFAQSVTVTERAPVVGIGYKVACPSGSRQIGGPKIDLGALTCLKATVDGLRIFHGPMLSFDNQGHVVSVGQMNDGVRTGTWTFFDSTGAQIGKTDFLKGEYHGRRVEFQGNGQVKFDENWVNGKRQGPQKSVDGSGVLTLTEYRDDRPVTK